MGISTLFSKLNMQKIAEQKRAALDAMEERRNREGRTGHALNQAEGSTADSSNSVRRLKLVVRVLAETR